VRLAARPLAVALVAFAVATMTLLATAGTASAAASASVSNTTPAPSQVVIVSASGLEPNSPTSIDFLPDGVHFSKPTADGNGNLSAAVTIPPDTENGDKQIVVTGIDASGQYAYLPIAITVKGSPGSISLSATLLIPNQAIFVNGTRFRHNTTADIYLLPEAVRLGTAQVDANRSFSIQVTIPDKAFNGAHEVVATGIGADGQYAYAIADAHVTGGAPGGVSSFAGGSFGTLPPPVGPGGIGAGANGNGSPTTFGFETTPTNPAADQAGLANTDTTFAQSAAAGSGKAPSSSHTSVVVALVAVMALVLMAPLALWVRNLRRARS
jgi:hypothetical protein